MHTISPRTVLLPWDACQEGGGRTLKQKHSKASFGEAELFAASFRHFPVPSCTHTHACWLQEPLTQQEWCTFSSWILLICERFSLNAFTGRCQANRIFSSAPCLLMKTRPFLKHCVMLCFIQITLKLSVMRLLQFLIPWNSTMNPLVVTSSWLSRMQKPYLGRAAGHRGCPWLNTSRYVLRLLVSFLVWVYPKKSLPSKKSIKLLYLDTDKDTMLLTGFLDCANTNSNRRSYWSRKINFD